VVKESGYVSLGRRNGTNWSVLAIARGNTFKEALKRGQGDSATARCWCTVSNRNKQFKKDRIDKKVRSIVAKANDNSTPNQYQTRVGQTLTPLINYNLFKWNSTYFDADELQTGTV